MEGLIQIIILICLILIIILLGIDKVRIVRTDKSPDPEIRPQDSIDIMGRVSVTTRIDSVEEKAKKSNIFEKLITNQPAEVKKQDIVTETFDGVDLVIDMDDESEEDFEFAADDDRFSQGVSLEELSKVGHLLQNSNLNDMQEKDTIEIIQKMQGTEMFASMQASIEGASQRIAKLLDKSLNNENNYRSTSLGNDIDNFDIGNFI